MEVGYLRTSNAGVVASIAGDSHELSQGSSVAWGEVIHNNSPTVLEIQLPALEPNQAANLLVLQPGAMVRLEQLGQGSNDAVNRTRVVALSDGVELFEISDEINTAVLVQEDDAAALGLVGTGLLAGSGAVASLFGAVAAGALLLTSDSDANAQTSSGVDPTENGGLAGGVQGVSSSVEQTPVAPVAPVADALASGLVSLGDAFNDNASQDPTGAAKIVAAVVGSSDSVGSADDGVVGLVASTSMGLTEGAQDSPLESLAQHVSATLGSDNQQTSGIAQAIGTAGTTLANDESVLSPITSDLIAPLVGDAGGQESGAASALLDTGDAVQVLTEDESPFAPLAPVTDGVATATVALADVSNEVGDTLYANGEQDPSGLVFLAGDLLGGDATSTQSSTPDEGGGQTESDPLNSLIDGIVGQGQNAPEPNEGEQDQSSPSGLAGAFESVSESLNETPLAPASTVTDPLSSGMVTVGDAAAEQADEDPSGLTIALSELTGNSHSQSLASEETGAVRVVSSISEGLSLAADGTALEPVVSPLADAIGSTDSSSPGLAESLGSLGNSLQSDQSPLAPVTTELLAPVVGDAGGEDSGMSHVLIDAGDALESLTTEESALAPAAPATDAIAMATDAAAVVLDEIGDAIYANGEQEPSGLATFVGEVLGGDSTGT